MTNATKIVLNTPIRAVQFFAHPFRLLVCALSIVCAMSIANAQTNINVGTTVKQTGAKRFGINLANQDFYDSGMMLRNLIFRNPGFEGQTWTTILECRTVTATSCQDSDPYSTWPANYMQNATYSIMTGAAAGVTGTVTTQDAASYTGNYGVTLHYSAPSIQPAAGDYIQVRTIFPGNAQAGWFVLNQSGAALTADTNAADQAPGTTGVQCLQVTGPTPGQSAQVAQLFDTSGSRSFIQLNGSFTITFKAKSIGGNNQFNLQIIRQTSPQQIYLNQNVNLTSSWATYSYTFNAAETGAAYGALGVYFNFDGNSLLLDDVQMSPDKNTYGTAFRDEVVSTLLTLKPGVLRYMDTAQGMGTSFDNMIKDQYGRRRAGWGQGTGMDTVPVGLFEFLRLCQVVGAEPWWTMPTATNKSEIAHVMEYMAGSGSTPYGAIRAAQGQAAPWTTVFPVIHLELGNEVWNGGSFTGETIVSPDHYGQWANSIFTAAKASSYYAGNSGKFDFIMGSLEVNDFWSQWEMDNCPSCDTLAVASYMFGTFDDYSSTEAIFGPLMAYPQWLDNAGPTGSDMYKQVQVARGINVSDANGTKYPPPNGVAIYETNMGTNTGTASQATVNATVSSVGAGVAETNHMLMMLRDLGVKTQNMFALSEYTNGFYSSGGSNASTTPLWGTVIDIGGPTNLRRPQFLGEQLANSAILPTVLATTQTGANPTWNQPLSANDQVQLNNAQYLQSYAFTDGTNNNLIVVNLHRTAALPVTFSGINAPSGNINVSQLTSTNITDNNETSPNVNITYTNVPNLDPLKPYSLPPFSVTVFSPGATLPASTTVLSATPTSINVGQSVSLSAVVTSSGTNTPSGSVTFMDGTTTLGTATLDSTGTASFSATGLAAGSHSLTAAYGGDSTDGRSVSSAVSVTVTGPSAVATTTTLSASATTAATGQNVTFTAAVTPQSGSGIATGAITFSDGTTTLGTGTLNAGAATFSTSTLAAGPHSIKASYGGDTNNGASASSALTVTITQGVTAGTNTLTYLPASPTTAMNVILKAKIVPASGNAVPTGTVTFKNGSAVMGTATLDGGGTATFQGGTLWAGTYSLTAIYAGDTANSSSTSPVVTMVVAPAATTTTLTASATTVSAGQPFTFTAAVANGIGASGTLTFKDGTNILGTGPLTGGSNATFTTSTLSAGPHSITASYSGDAQNAPSVSSSVAVTISSTSMSTTTTLTTSATTLTIGQNVTFSAAVTPQSGTAVPTGTVTFSDGSAAIGTGTLSAGGIATFSTTALGVGAHSIKASYGGDTGNVTSSSSTITVTVLPVAAATSTILTSSATTAMPGQSISFTATVAPQSGTGVPTGTVIFSDGVTTVGTGTLGAGGSTTISTASLAPGAHAIKATYSGDMKDSASASSTITITIAGAPVTTSTTLTAAPNAATTGQNISLTATVTPQSGSGIPTGTVTFSDGAATMGTGSLNAGGTATINTTSLAVGTHIIKASYGGDTNNSASVSSMVTVTISAVISATTANLTYAPSSPTTAMNIVLYTKIVPATGSGTPTGSVVFKNGSSALGSATLDATGTATYQAGTLWAGTYNLTAIYSGDTSDSPATSSTVLMVVAPAATATTVTASANSANPGQSLTFTAIVANGVSATGTVTFKDGGTTLGTGSLNGGSTATFTTSALGAGAHSIVASYSGDSQNATSASSSVAVTILQAVSPTTTALIASATTVATGQNIIFNATVTPQTLTGVPTGAVTFLDGATVIGAGTLNGSGVAAFSTSSLAVGPHSIRASYAGDANNTSSSSSAIALSISQTVVATATTLATSAITPAAGQNISFTATVTPKSGSGIPTGTVTFSDGPSTIGAASDNGSGAVVFNITSLGAGSHHVMATYSGDSKNAGSASAPVAITVMQATAATTTTLTASPTSATTGQTISFTASVAEQSGGAIPGGTVTFSDGGMSIGTGILNGSGVAVFTSSTLTAGSHSIAASYGGDAKNTTSASSALTVNVSQTAVATTTSLSASATTATTGQNITFTAAVARLIGSVVPTGSVKFEDGQTTLGTATVNASGVATFNTGALIAGSHSISAFYSGDSTDAGSGSSGVAVNISQGLVATTTTLATSAATAQTGQLVTLNATVVPQTGSTIPTGTISFMDGSATLATVALNSTGAANFATSSLASGSHTITASYSGDAKDNASASSAVAVTISQSVAPTATSLAATPSTNVSTGQSISLTATVTVKSGTGIPGGTVTFLDGATPVGSALLGSGGTALFSTTSLTAGIHTITAVYGGDAKDAGSISPATTIVIAQTIATTTTALTASAVSAATGQSVTFTAMVASKPVSGVPTGTVTYFDGATALGTGTVNASGVATFSSTTLASGIHTITAAYGGDAMDAASTSSAITVTISQTLIATTTSIAASTSAPTAGQSLTFTAAVTPQSGTVVPTGTITFFDRGVTLGTATLNAGGSAGLTTSSLAGGTHSVTASYSGDTKDAASASSTVTVNIAQAVVATTTTLSISPALSILGQSVSMTVVVTPQSGNGVPTGKIIFYNGQTALHTSTLNAGTAVFSTSLLNVGTYSITAVYSSDQFDAASTSPAVSETVTTSPDYSLSVNVSNLIVVTGQSATATVSVMPVNGFNQTVQLSCSGLPSGASCSFAPSAVTPSGGATVSSTVTISMNTAALAVPSVAPLTGVSYGMLMPWGLISLLGMGAGARRSRFSNWTSRIAVAGVLLGASMAMTGCGFTITTPGGTKAQATPVNYLVTITGMTSDATTHDQVITLQVTK